MRVITRYRRAGKSTYMIHWVSQDKGRTLLVHNHQEAKRLRKEFPFLAKQIITWDGRKQMVGTKTKEVGIDNADMILQDYVGKPISIITTTIEEDEV